MKSSTFLIPAVAVAAIGVLSSIFVVDERENALVLQFGQIVRTQTEPGIGFKLPLLQSVVKYDSRILSLETPTVQVTPSDDRRLDVDAFARYRINDIVRFRERLGNAGSSPADQIRVAERQLGDILTEKVRQVLGADQVTSSTILSDDRRGLMNRIRDASRTEAQAFGLEVVDVRLITTNLPEQNLAQTFARMRAEREQEAVDERARGAEAARGIRALANRTARETVAIARRDAQIVIGEADAQSNATLNAAFGADPEFFAFYQSMLNYESTVTGDNSTLVITPDSPFFEYFFAPGAGSGLGAISDQDVDALLDDAVGDMEVQESVVEPLNPDDLDTMTNPTGDSDTNAFEGEADSTAVSE